MFHSMKFNHWSIDDNELHISLMRFYVKIIPTIMENNLTYQLLAIHGEDSLCIGFDDLASAVCFTEDVISNEWTINDVLLKYQELVKGKSKVLR